jgi:streptogramin lyase
MNLRLFILFFFISAFNISIKAQTVTDPWANIGRNPYYMAIDASNNIYVTSFANNTVSKITPNGTVTADWATNVGSGPAGIVIDAAGNLYTANRGSKTISKITPSSDGSSGSVIQFASLNGNEAYTISIDASGNLYAPFVNTNKIAKIAPDGTANLSWVIFGDGSKPFSLIFDASGNLYSANASNSTIHKINTSGVITYTWPLANGSNFQFMTFDAAGNLYIACDGTSTVSKITPSGTATAAWASLTGKPAGIVSDAAGNIFTANTSNSTISKITSDGTVTQSFVSLATGSFPFNLLKDASGNLYTTNLGINTLSKVSYAPSVTITSSASGAVCAGTNVTFTAVASNISSPTYQWTKNGIAIAGAYSSTYSSTTLSNNDQIKVWVNAGIDNSKIVSNGLLLNLDASNPGSYSGTGNNWYDLSGNNNHATLMNSPTFDAVSKSVVTNGTNQYINIPSLNTSNSNITMQAWIYFDGSTRPGALIGAKNGYSIGKGNSAYDVAGNNLVLLLYGAAGGWKATGQSYSSSGWKLVTMTLDGSSTARAYIDGTLKYTYSGAAPSTPLGDLNLGAIPEDGYRYYDGKFAAAYFYNRAFSLAEIQQNYDAFATKSTGYGSNTITVAVTGSAPIITVTGDACVYKTNLTTPSGLTSYAWYKDNVIINGATSNTYTPTASGAYQVQVTSGSCSSTSTATTIYECGRTADGRMTIVEGSTTLVSRDGSINNGKGVTESGKIVTKPWAYGTVTTATGRIWLDRNLGASRVATSSTDALAYGDYYQWGRPADGHQTKYLTNNNSSGFTNTKSSSSVPSTDLWIVPTDASNDWLITPDNSLWSGANPATNPCPTGFRIPTEAEWSAENIANVTATFQTNGLKLTLPGMLTNFGSGGASYTDKNTYGQYLTQTAYTTTPVIGGARYFGVNASNQAWFNQNYYKSHGMSVRCIKNP